MKSIDTSTTKSQDILNRCNSNRKSKNPIDDISTIKSSMILRSSIHNSGIEPIDTSIPNSFKPLIHPYTAFGLQFNVNPFSILISKKKEECNLI